MTQAVVPNLPLWAQWLAALAVPIAAIAGVALGVLTYLLNRQKRRDELFDRQYRTFSRLLNLQDHVVDEVQKNQTVVDGYRFIVGKGVGFRSDPDDFGLICSAYQDARRRIASGKDVRGSFMTPEYGSARSFVNSVDFIYRVELRRIIMEVQLLFGAKFADLFPDLNKPMLEVDKALRDADIPPKLIRAMRLRR